MKYLYVMVLTILLTACGNYGKLYLDDPYVKAHTTPQQPIAPSKNLHAMPRGLV